VKLRSEDQEFRNPRLFYSDPKAVELDRVLVNLFLLLRCDGTRPATRARHPANFDSVAYHRGRLGALGNPGFAEHTGVAQAWLESDVFDVVNRGKPGAEAIASLRPLHLDAAKVRIGHRCRDYNVADHLYACLEHGERRTIDLLRAYLDRGRDPGTKKYDGTTSLDLETLAVLRLVEDIPQLFPSETKAAPYAPICIGQARMLCDDVLRLLAYQDCVPRSVMIEYLRAVVGVHTGLYMLRIARQLEGWIADKAAHPSCRNCPVQASNPKPFEGCPYNGGKFVVDMGTDFRSRMARMSQESAAEEYGRMAGFTRSAFVMNQLLRYATHARHPGKDSPMDAVGILASPPPDMEGYFGARLADIKEASTRGEGTLKPDEQALFDYDMSSFDRFIEVILHERHGHHREELRKFLDKVFQKNTEYGSLAQGKSASNPRRWHLGPRMLEVLVQLAVLHWEEKDGKKQFFTEPMLIDDFVQWVEARYGFVIAKTGNDAGATVSEHAAYRENMRQLRVQLREIGFFDDLSDAFNAQTLRPRYAIDQRSGS
jgi:hypothetical protein